MLGIRRQTARLGLLAPIFGLAFAIAPACSMFLVPEDNRAAAAVIHSLLGDSSGGGSSAAFCPVTDYTALFSDTGQTLTGVGQNTAHTSTNFADVDGDGDMDLLITGNDGATQTAKLYLNDGAGNFAEDGGAGLTAVENSASAFADVDGDGDLDLVITGDTDGADTLSAILYRNDGAGNFTNAGAPLTGVDWSTVDFADIEGDGDLDLILTGSTGGGIVPSTAVYTNDGAGNFTNAGTRGLDVNSAGMIATGDVDGDGDLDILMAGYDGAANFAKLFTNDGSGNFTDSGQALTGLRFGFVELADLDNDGDLDILLSGETNRTLVYLNDGGGNFTSDGRKSLHDRESGSGTVGDVDGDGDLDLVLSGDNSSVAGTRLFINRGDGTFVEQEAGLSGVTFSGLDLADVDGDGDLDLAVVGLGPAAAVYRNHLDADPVLPGFNCSIVEPTLLFSIVDSGVTGLLSGSVDFGDIDGDGDLDLLTTGNPGSGGTSNVWRNNGNFSFTDTGSVLSSVRESDGKFADVDGDSDLDLVISGRFGSISERTELYRNDGTGNFTLDAAASAGLINLQESALEFGDLDNDGDQDLLLTGRNGGTRYARVYANDGTGNFTDASAGLTGLVDAGLELADLDGDGDLDLVITGEVGTFTRLSRIYRNDGGLTFSDSGAALTHVEEGSISSADLDGDGDLDLLITGLNGSGRHSLVYRNDGGFAFTDIGAGLPGIRHASLIVDIDQDGDADLLGSGNGATEDSAFTYLNDGSMNFTRVYTGLMQANESDMAAADLDGDGDMDLLLIGSVSGRPEVIMYRNNAR